MCYRWCNAGDIVHTVLCTRYNEDINACSYIIKTLVIYLINGKWLHAINLSWFLRCVFAHLHDLSLYFENVNICLAFVTKVYIYVCIGETRIVNILANKTSTHTQSHVHFIIVQLYSNLIFYIFSNLKAIDVQTQNGNDI